MVDSEKLAVAVRAKRGSRSLRKAAEEAGVSYETLRGIEEKKLTPTLEIFMRVVSWIGIPNATEFFRASKQAEAA